MENHKNTSQKQDLASKVDKLVDKWWTTSGQDEGKEHEERDT